MDTQTLQSVALFDKCRQFTKAREVQAAGLYPYFKPISESEDTSVVIEGQKRIMLGSNNYLGLTHHPQVLEAASRALHRYGSGCTGSRFLNGTLDLHGQLERSIAEFLGKEDCLVFSTGFLANLGLIAGLISRGDVVYLDKLDHASIVDGAKLSYGTTERFNHGDLAGLQRKMERDQAKGISGAMIIVDGVYSMEGDIADVAGLVKIARKYGAALALDDAHSIGVLGPRGDGTAAHFGLTDEVDIIAGTFSKSLASIGGFVAGSESVIHYLKHNSRPLIFTASLPPVEHRRRAGRAGGAAARRPGGGISCGPTPAGCRTGSAAWASRSAPPRRPIVPVLIGPLEKTFLMWRKLFDAGVFTNPVTAPAVPITQCRLRTSVMATHTFDQIDYCVETFGKIGRELGVI